MAEIRRIRSEAYELESRNGVAGAEPA
jgi:hypothetical protein